MELWGLTGGIACGKSTVAARLRQLGATVIDADVLAREVVAPGSPGLEAVVQRFGPGILKPDGSLDRAALGAVVFADPAARADLNAITHPRIAALSAEQTAQAQAAGAPVVIYEAPLLIENGLHHGMNQVLVVAAPAHVQLARLMARDGLDEAAARARVASQLPLAEKRKAATVVFENDGSPAQLVDQVDRFWRVQAPRNPTDPPPPLKDVN